MKKLLLAIPLALLLGACASLQADWAIVTGATVSPTQIIVAANAFDAGEASATQYLLFCKATVPAPSYCALATRQAVVKAVRAGRAARDGLEAFLQANPGALGSQGLYAALTGATSTINAAVAAYNGA